MTLSQGQDVMLGLRTVEIITTGVGDIDPQRTRSYLWGFTPQCPILWKSTKKYDREIDHTRTDRQQTDFIICPMLYAIAMGQIIVQILQLALNQSVGTIS